MYELVANTFTSPRGNNVQLLFRKETADWNTAWASLNEDEYGLGKLPPLRGWALDIGGYLGTVSLGLAIDNPDLRVICVEPVPENVQFIRSNIWLNEIADRIHVLEGGAAEPGIPLTTVRYAYETLSGDEEALREELQRLRTNADPSELQRLRELIAWEVTSHHAFVGNIGLIEGTGMADAPHRELETACYSIGAIARAFKVDHFALLKIDCEGCEWSVLKDPFVVNCDVIVGEFHPIGGHRRSDLVDLLGATHRISFHIPDGVDPEIGPGEFIAERGVER